MWKKILIFLALIPLCGAVTKVWGQDPIITAVNVLPFDALCGKTTKLEVIVEDPGPGNYTITLRRSNGSQIGSVHNFSSPMQDTFIVEDIQPFGSYNDCRIIFANSNADTVTFIRDIEIFGSTPSIFAEAAPIAIVAPACSAPDSILVELRAFRRGSPPYVVDWILDLPQGDDSTIRVDAIMGTGDDSLALKFPIPPLAYEADVIDYRVFGFGSQNLCGSNTLELDEDILPPPKSLVIESIVVEDATVCGGEGLLKVKLDDVNNYAAPFSIIINGNAINGTVTGDTVRVPISLGVYNGIVVEDNDACRGTIGQQVDVFEPLAPLITGENLGIRVEDNCQAFGTLLLGIDSDYTGEGPYNVFLNGMTYSGRDSAIFAIIENLPVGTYAEVIIEDDFNCRDTFSFSSPLIVAADNAPVLTPFAVDSLDKCANETFPILAEASGGTGTLNFVWTLPDNSTQDLDSLLLATEGRYTLTVSDSVGCAATQDIVVTNLPTPGLSFDPSRIVSVETGLEVTISWQSDIPGTSFSWTATSPGNIALIDTIGTDSTVTETFTLAESADQGQVFYMITASFEGCVSMDTVEVRILRETGPETFIIPDVFTPNGDGTNEVWDIRYPISLDPATYQVKVYNRSGGLVHDRNLSTPWDGGNLPDGPYFYIISNNADPSGTPVRGAVSIIRKQP